MNLKRLEMVIGAGVGIMATLSLLWLLSTPRQITLAQTGTGVIRVATTGSDTPGCGGVADPCATIQYAVDLADPGDEVHVAGGVYNDLHVRPRNDVTAIDVVTQVVYISKTVTIRGGYVFTRGTFIGPADPEANPTVLDAQGQGRVLYVTSPAPGAGISPTIEGLRITGGDAAGLGGHPWGSWDLGGGAYMMNASAIISDNQVFDNAAHYGGGLYLLESDATLNGNTVSSNTAYYGGGVYLSSSDALLGGNTIFSNNAHFGGGLYLYFSGATFNDNTVSFNTVDEYGGGLYLGYSEATLSGNVITANAAIEGGGLELYESDATLNSNIIFSNTAHYDGGGLYLWSSDATLSDNTFFSNTANAFGGGLSLLDSDATLSGNTISSNTANENGGGLYLSESDARFDRNVISSNTADNGGGLYLAWSGAVLVNTLIADNQANAAGSGLYIVVSSPRLFHTTIARNGGGSGIHVRGFTGTVALSNTILVGHDVGITVEASNTASLEATLWGNDTDWDGNGDIFTGTYNYWADPAFVDPDGGDYHISSSSAARDAGIDAGAIGRDIDDQMRPMDWGYDIGADEYLGAGLEVVKQPAQGLVNVSRIHRVLTYTIGITSAGRENVTAVVLTDTLDGWQRAIAVASSMGGCTVTDGGWGGTVVCAPGAMVTGTTAVVTLTAQISTALTMGSMVTNAVVVRANETVNRARTRITLQDCHARINDNPTPYTSLQAAVDVASPGDLVKVAGVCVGASEREGPRQHVYVDKSITIQGGYTTTFTDPPDPVANPTILDAQGQGRVLYITWNVSSTIEGLHLTGGDATGLGGGGFCEGGCSVDAGGGVCILSGINATFKQNRIYGNNGELGGGMYVRFGNPVIRDNVFANNTAASGGGLFLRATGGYSPLTMTLQGNVISGNVASSNGGGMVIAGFDGMGTIDARPAPVLLENNTIVGNVAACGGGLDIDASAPTLLNNIITDNRANSIGGGVYVSGGAPQLLHTTIARNSGGDGSGVLVDGGYPWMWDDRTTALTNTILVSHTVGITVAAGNTVTLEATLWGTGTWANGADWGGTGAIITGTVNVWGDPAFTCTGAVCVDPYRIDPSSAALDAGVDAGVRIDIDYEPRPYRIPDLGADEYWPPGLPKYVYLPLVLRNH